MEVLYSTPTPTSLSGQGSYFSREEHAMKELSLVGGSKRAPRRSQTQQNYQIPQFSLVTIPTTPPQQRPRAIEDNPTPITTAPPSPGEQQPQQEPTPVRAPPRRRPALGPPRRSYSVTDREPIPHHHRPSPRLALVDLPGELHFAIFDFLDPIDSTCLGLANRHFYAIHRRMRGTVTLSTRRDGPNELEWAWHLAGAVVKIPPSPSVYLKPDAAVTPSKALLAGEEEVVGTTLYVNDREKTKALSKLRVRGQAYCRKCGVTRCELHKHIQSWMGEGAEYCSIKQKFGPAAPEGAKPYCYMSKPGDPHRCGRHRMRKSKVMLQ